MESNRSRQTFPVPWRIRVSAGSSCSRLLPGLQGIDPVLVDEPGLKEGVMISLRQRLQCLPLLFGGIGAGLVLALIPRISSGRGADPAIVMVVAGLSFFLSVLTGV